MESDRIIREFSSRMNFITPLRYVSGRIVEYDLKSANINTLYQYSKIDKQYYDYLSRLPKMDREIEIGLRIRSDGSLYDTIQEGIKEAKFQLLKTNNVDLNSVVRIANDAVYINTSVDLNYTRFDNLFFTQKSISNCMVKLGNLIIFFWYDNDGNMNIDVKGLNEVAMNLHSDYLLSIIAQVINMVERVSINDALKYLLEFYNDYINMKLEKEYYRELTPESLYRIKNSDYGLISVESLDIVDINYNLYVLRELYSILLEKVQYKK